MDNKQSIGKKIAAFSGILFFVVMACEIIIMISPFAFFFYSVFSPFFNFLGQHAATRWLTVFFLPHMILPPTLFLKSVRVAGSIFFLVGLCAFVVCALQVYLGKVLKWGVAARGLYQYIRHPQYLSLGIWGIGMAILWPRFIVSVTLSLMFVLYHFLAKDEEGRMLQQYGASYENYLRTTGRFLPRALERPRASLTTRIIPSPMARAVLFPVVIFTLVVGTGLVLRQITLSSLPMTIKDNMTLVPILPEDSRVAGAVANGIAEGVVSGKIPFLKADQEYVGYVMPPDYLMQGMIADTGGHFHLFKKHHTVGLIWDWVFHPFEHLRRPPAAHMAAMHQTDPQMARRHHCPLGVNQPQRQCETCTFKRVIVVHMDAPQGTANSGRSLLSRGALRTPVGFVDLDTQDGKIISAQPVAKGTAWQDVPTPDI